MSKICTDIEQSKKLLELGTNTRTADCYWDYDVQGKSYYPMFLDEQYDDMCVPAWSLTALLNLLPFPILYQENIGGAYFWRCDVNLLDGETFIGIPHEEQVDSVFEMVCLMLQKNSHGN